MYPTDNKAAILAMGKPVALLAKAEDLLTLGFISITITSPFFGFTANCILLPPVSTPTSLIIFKDKSLSLWYSLSVNV